MKTVLVVDSSEAHARHVTDALAEAGFGTLLRRDPEDLVAFVRRHRPDVILLDEFMPALRGLQALRALSRDPATRRIPVVMLASRAQPADKVRALWQGAREYLVRPVDAARLVRLVNALTIGGVQEPPVGAARIG